MGDHVSDDIGVARDHEIESPVPVDSRLPKIEKFIVSLSAQGRMIQIAFKERQLLVECLPPVTERSEAISMHVSRGGDSHRGRLSAFCFAFCAMDSSMKVLASFADANE